MEKIPYSSLSMILGGDSWADPEKCHELQVEAGEMAENPDTSNEDWDKWSEKFYEYCVGITPP